MGRHVLLVSKALATAWAVEGFLACVSEDVPLQIPGTSKLSATDLTI